MLPQMNLSSNFVRAKKGHIIEEYFEEEKKILKRLLNDAVSDNIFYSGDKLIEIFKHFNIPMIEGELEKIYVLRCYPYLPYITSPCKFGYYKKLSKSDICLKEVLGDNSVVIGEADLARGQTLEPEEYNKYCIGFIRKLGEDEYWEFV